MKNLTKFFVMVCLLTFSANTFAQTFGVKAGLNLSNLVLKHNDETLTNSMKPGFHIGPTAEIPINEMFSFEPAVLLSTKGYKYSEPGYDESINLLYIDVPLTGKATYDVGGVKIYGAFGPYVGVGLTGKYKTSDSPDYTLKWGKAADDDLERFNYGLVFGAGVEFNAFQLGISYELGLANMAPSDAEGEKIHDRVLGISLGYWFGKE